MRRTTIRKVFQVILTAKKKTSPAAKNNQIYTFLITETTILADRCKISGKDGLDFTFIWIHDREDRRGRIRDGWHQSERSWYLEYKMAASLPGYKMHDTEKRREPYLIPPIFGQNFNPERGKSFNFISFYVFCMIWDDPSRSELIRVDPTRTGSPSWSGPTFVPASFSVIYYHQWTFQLPSLLQELQSRSYIYYVTVLWEVIEKLFAFTM